MLYEKYSRYYLTGFLPILSYSIPFALYDIDDQLVWCDMSMGWSDRLLSAIVLQDKIK
jgi:hypothetical protein